MSGRRTRRAAPAALAVVLAAATLAPGPARAAEPAYRDAWDPAAEQAAAAAVARLGAKRALDIRRTELAIRGLEGGVAGTGRGIVATVQQVKQAMQALNAEETDLVVKVELPADVLFDFDQADIRNDAAAALAHVATLIRAYPDGGARLEGHTDAKGEDAYNQRLSERRAEAVKRWLVEREGLAAARLTTQGLGESRPVASNGDDAGRQRNRRVEVVIRKR